MEKVNYHNKWWFWLFVTIMFLTLCFSFSSCVVGTELARKGEYKITLEAGDNFKQISENVKQAECPKVEYSCSNPWSYSPYYQTNYSIFNDSFYGNWNLTYLPNLVWVSSSIPHRTKSPAYP